MIRDLVLDREPAKPTIGEVHLHITAQRPLRADREHVADDEHPDHEHRINRRPTCVRVVRCQFLVHPAQIENAVDLPDQMVGRHYLVEIKRVEKLALSIPLPPHHWTAPANHRLNPTESRFAHCLNQSFATKSATNGLMHRSKHRLYSITSSARVNIRGETVRPIAFAVLRLSTNSNLVPIMTGKSAGLSPLRIRPA